MTAAKSRARRSVSIDEAQRDARRLSIADLVLLRIAVRPATRAELQRDLLPLFGDGRAAGTAFRQTAELAIGGFASRSLITDAKGRLQTTAMGRAEAARVLPGFGAIEDWTKARIALLAAALQLPNSGPAIFKSLQRHDGLAALVLQRHFAMPADRARSPNDLRAALAVIALERAFGNRIKTGFGNGAGLPGKAGRILAGQLFASPREFSSDGKLILALAADVAGARDATFEALCLAVLRKLTSEAPRRADAPAPIPASPQPAPDNDALPSVTQSPAGQPASVRADMTEFAGAVLDAARPVAQGWPGNRKAFISLVWQAIRNARPDWGLSETAFKSMLSEAHRTGAIVLASADLKDRCDLKELEDSKILYKNTVWHFVRVED